MTRILIVDDHAIVRHGLRQLLEAEDTFDVIADVSTAHDALHVLRSAPCDVILLDITMPNKNGLEFIGNLQDEFPALCILVLSMHSEEQFGIRALKAGAAAYLTKDADTDLIIQAIRKIAAGGKFLTPQLGELLERQLHTTSTLAPHKTLSTREFSVFIGIINGKSLTAIAEELSLNVKTVSNYRARALEKMNMKCNADFIHYAHRNGLVS